ncbi:hypothetical protein Bca4012_007694 [Brassica carinata]
MIRRGDALAEERKRRQSSTMVEVLPPDNLDGFSHHCDELHSHLRTPLVISPRLRVYSYSARRRAGLSSLTGLTRAMVMREDPELRPQLSCVSDDSKL